MLKQLLVGHLIQGAIDKLGFAGKVTVDEVLAVIEKVKADPKTPHDSINSAQIMAVMAIVCDVAAILHTDVCPIIGH